MKIAMYYNNSDIRLEEMPIPEISDGEILVKVMASGICGSDVMEWYRVKKAPLVLGHETTGTVEKVGKGVGFKEGERVFVTHHVPCYKCHTCKRGAETSCETLHTTKFYPGGFSEYLRLPKINVDNFGIYKLPDNVSFEGGTFIEPLGCVVRGQRIANVQKGDTVLVIGSGLSGLLHIQLAKEKGAKKIIATDIDNFRLEMAKRFGADAIHNAKNELNEKADVVILCAAAPAAIEQAIKSVDKGGTILIFAMASPETMAELPLNEMSVKGATITTSYAAAKQDLEEAIELLKNGKIKVKEMITHRLPLKDTQKGFQLTAKPQNSLKVIIEPHK